MIWKVLHLFTIHLTHISFGPSTTSPYRYQPILPPRDWIATPSCKTSLKMSLLHRIMVFAHQTVVEKLSNAKWFQIFAVRTHYKWENTKLQLHQYLEDRAKYEATRKSPNNNLNNNNNNQIPSYNPFLEFLGKAKKAVDDMKRGK